jgi:hypothetical protein
VTRVYVELSGESPALARAEAEAVAEVAGGHVPRAAAAEDPLLPLELPPDQIAPAAGRLALARRLLVELPDGGEFRDPSSGPRRPGEGAAFRRLGQPSGGTDPRGIDGAARAWKSAGGRIDLDTPERRFWWAEFEAGRDRLLEEVAAVDRAATSRRRISSLPFQRPIGLAPKLARAAANLARIRPGDLVVDPFLGTGALLAEAGLLGARVTGVDLDAAMVRGAQRNLAHLGVVADRLIVGDSADPDVGGSETTFDALLTDPPYGRASGTGGEPAGDVVRRVLPRWADQLRRSAYAVVVLPGGPDPLPDPWRRILAVPVRVHRSLTREFRVYRRGD